MNNKPQPKNIPLLINDTIVDPLDVVNGLESPHSCSIREIIKLIDSIGLDGWDVEPLKIDIPDPKITRSYSPQVPMAPRKPLHFNIFHAK